MAPRKEASTKPARSTAATKAKANTSAKVKKPASEEKQSPTAIVPAKKVAVQKTADGGGAAKPSTTAKGDNKTETKASSTTKSKSKEATASKKAEPKKAASKKPTVPKKREADDEVPEAPSKDFKKLHVSKKRKTEDEVPAAPPKKAKYQKGPIINEAPSEKLDVFVFGEGSSGELGLGVGRKDIDVKRPRLNPNLSGVGVVQLAAGGMHVVALTRDNKILTWGVNDNGALGRDTNWDGGLKDISDDKSDADSDESEDDTGMNPKESTPGEVDWSETEVPEDTIFTQVTAGDSCSFALTDDGKVYGWGCFRNNEGVLGFTPEVEIARRPMLIGGLKDITSLAAGSNHALALTSKGIVFAWGSGQQNQLGRRIVERKQKEGLKPRELALPKGGAQGICSISSGGDHSFAITREGVLYSWGLNSFGGTGIMEGAGGDEATVMTPQIVTSLKGQKVQSVVGGSHHSLAITENGDLLAWGRVDANALGISIEDIKRLPAEAVVLDGKGDPRILAVPQKVTAVNGQVALASASSDTSIAITREGKAWSWGFSANYQTGQGTFEDVVRATVIDNTAVRERKLNGAANGGQFSLVTASAKE